ncbi:hypothetical protein [Nocardioides speluncae]|uniref:hypothetical protein n=1 Tax=Nocardioides speluncae TaxID=2670337 RepID=UPI000D69B929|nr:hypothetical protein [Nocardioides speluncae]
MTDLHVGSGRASVTSDLEEAARRALNAIVILETVEDGEPSASAPDSEWEEWNRTSHRPAYRAWTQAMDRLEHMLGEDFPGRECRAWVPVCVRILSGELR